MTTDYDPVRGSELTEPLFVLFPMSDIETINPFDPEVYAKYFTHKQANCPGFFDPS
jgi:hypothetical protein